jgi:hypothetical protein
MRMKALLALATLLSLCSCAAQLGSGGGSGGGDDGSTGGGGDDTGGSGGSNTGSGGGSNSNSSNIAPGLQRADALAQRSDPDLKEIGQTCLQAEADWQSACNCPLTVMMDLTRPNYREDPLDSDDQRGRVEFICDYISDDIKTACAQDATDMCKMSTLNMVRVDVDQLDFTVTGSTGNGQINWDGYETDIDAISFVLAGRNLAPM